MSVRMAGFEPAFSSTPSWRIARLSYILKQGTVQVAEAMFHASEDHGQRRRKGIEPYSFGLESNLSSL